MIKKDDVKIKAKASILFDRIIERENQLANATQPAPNIWAIPEWLCVVFIFCTKCWNDESDTEINLSMCDYELSEQSIANFVAIEVETRGKHEPQEIIYRKHTTNTYNTNKYHTHEPHFGVCWMLFGKYQWAQCTRTNIRVYALHTPFNYNYIWYLNCHIKDICHYSESSFFLFV